MQERRCSLVRNHPLQDDLGGIKSPWYKPYYVLHETSPVSTEMVVCHIFLYYTGNERIDDEKYHYPCITYVSVLRHYL